MLQPHVLGLPECDLRAARLPMKTHIFPLLQSQSSLKISDAILHLCTHSSLNAPNIDLRLQTPGMFMGNKSLVSKMNVQKRIHSGPINSHSCCIGQQIWLEPVYVSVHLYHPLFSLCNQIMTLQYLNWKSDNGNQLSGEHDFQKELRRTSCKVLHRWNVWSASGFDYHDNS